MQIVKIQNWKVVNIAPYKPPEQWVMGLCGEVYGHPNFADGSPVQTSRICGTFGTLVYTKNTMYILDGVDPEYRRWVDEQGLKWDDAEPVKVIES